MAETKGRRRGLERGGDELGDLHERRREKVDFRPKVEERQLFQGRLSIMGSGGDDKWIGEVVTGR